MSPPMENAKLSWSVRPTRKDSQRLALSVNLQGPEPSMGLLFPQRAAHSDLEQDPRIDANSGLGVDPADGPMSCDPGPSSIRSLIPLNWLY